MSVKKEPSGKRSIFVEVEVPGTPEQVWQAIASGPGVSAWFVPTEMDQHEGGKVVSHFGGGFDAEAKITEWKDGQRFTAVSSAYGPDSPEVATEWIVEANSGGTCTVRVVHSLFASTDDWDDQLTNLESGWPAFFRILRVYLTHFPGQKSTNMQFMGMVSGDVAAAWKSLLGPLGLDGSPAGAAAKPTAGAPELSGRVELSEDGDHPYKLLLIETPATGAAIFNACPAGEQTMLSVNFYLYGDQGPGAVADAEAVWAEWFKGKLTAAAV